MSRVCVDLSNGGATSAGGTPGSGGALAMGGEKSSGGATAAGGNSSLGGMTGDGGNSTEGGTAPTGGTAAGGDVSMGLGGVAGSSGAGGEGVPFACGRADASVQIGEAGLLRIGYTDPAQGVVLTTGGHYAMPNIGSDAGSVPRFEGDCWTYTDGSGSTLFPPCGSPYPDGGLPPCFTADSSLCVSASLGSKSSATWGAGFGCQLGQVPNGGNLYVHLDGLTKMIISVYGCAVPDQLQIQLNVVNPPLDEAGVSGSGYFCVLATLGAPDARGMRTAIVQLADFQQDCWRGGGLRFDRATMNVVSMQAQINTLEGLPTNWDFCVSKWALE